MTGQFASQEGMGVALQYLQQRVSQNAGMKFAAYRLEPVNYIKKFLGWSPWSGAQWDATGQQEIISAYRFALAQQLIRREYQLTGLSGRDLDWVPDDLADCWSDGVEIKNWIRVESGHSTGKCVSATEGIILDDGRAVSAAELVGHRAFITGKDHPVLAYFTDNGVKPVWRITLEGGVVIERTGNHPLWAADRTPAKSGSRMRILNSGWKPAKEIKAGNLVASVVNLHTRGKDTLSINEVALVALLIGDGSMTGSNFRITSADEDMIERLEKSILPSLGFAITRYGGYEYGIRASESGASPRKWADNLGIRKLAYDKSVPDEIMGASLAQKATFLSYLFHTDGWYTQKGAQPEIGYCSVSKRLMDDVTILLRQFGIRATVFKKETGHADTWQLFIHNWRDQLLFIENIDIENKDSSFVLDNALKLKEKFDRNFRADRPFWRHKNAPSNTEWVRVVSVEEVAPVPTVAISVPDGETFATLVYEHNTKLASGIASHFFDSFSPGGTYAFAPTYEQINDLLFKELRQDRRKADLPGNVLKRPILQDDAAHFIKGKATGNNQTEAVQGQHLPAQLFILDEAEGVDDYVFDAVESMTSGGISIVLMLANPRTTYSRFHRIASAANVRSFRMSCLDHPNVRLGREVVPNAVSREYVDAMCDKHCVQVTEHDPDSFTFELEWVPGKIFSPDNEYMFRVMGLAPPDNTSNSFCPIGRYEAASERGRKSPQTGVKDKADWARIGIDCARYGDDVGTIYVRRGDDVWREHAIKQQDGYFYYTLVLELINKLINDGVKNIEIRVDGGGGYGSTIIDNLSNMDNEGEWDNLEDFHILEVVFQSVPYEPNDYSNLVTEMYAHAGQAMKVLNLRDVPETLRADLCGRPYKYIKMRGRDVKTLLSKEQFRKQFKRSPDDGDGFVLAVAPDYVVGVIVDIGFA